MAEWPGIAVFALNYPVVSSLGSVERRELAEMRLTDARAVRQGCWEEQNEYSYRFPSEDKSLKIKMFAVAVATGLGLVGGSVLSAAPAQAGIDECASQYFCLWEHPDYKGKVLRVFGGNSDLRSPIAFNDINSSGRNNTNDYYCVYEHVNFEGQRWEWAPHASFGTLGSDNDRVSSVQSGRCW